MARHAIKKGVTVRAEMKPGNPVISMFGDIDMSTADAFASALAPCVGAGGPVPIDLSGVSFMDSTGVYVLLDAATSLGDRGCIIVHGVHDGVAKVIEMTGLANARGNIHIVGCSVLVQAA
jgi:anti-anti-sigma factor